MNSFPVHAITLDLDDTIWPVMPAIVGAELALDAWLVEHAPRAARMWPLDERQRLRQVANTERPHLTHDMTAQRQWMLERMLVLAGEDVDLATDAYTAYFAARCDVDHYADSVPALERLAAKLPLAALSNGNACLHTIGLMHLFAFQLGASEHGAAKPAASIFHAACDQLGVAAQYVLHVGDDPRMDVVGAHRAGLRTCWINRPDASGKTRSWQRSDIRPDLEFSTLAALADWLDATHHQDPISP
ncbi:MULTISPECIES: HAD family hydrolase [unclassified Lysobacter]